jgi:hypothetical protein
MQDCFLYSGSIVKAYRLKKKMPVQQEKEHCTLLREVSRAHSNKNLFLIHFGLIQPVFTENTNNTEKCYILQFT